MLFGVRNCMLMIILTLQLTWAPEFSKVVSQLVLLFITQASIGIGLPFLALVLYFLQRLYLHTSRQIRFLDIELRAKVLSNFLETVSYSGQNYYMKCRSLTACSSKEPRISAPLAGSLGSSTKTSRTSTYPRGPTMRCSRSSNGSHSCSTCW